MKRFPFPVLAFLLLSAVPAFASVQVQPRRLDEVKAFFRTADFNGDGLDDVFATRHLQFNLGGRFAPPLEVNEIPSSDPEVGVAGLARFDGDAFADILVRRGREASVLLGNGFGSFKKRALPDMNGWVQEVLDFNGDGIGDLIVTRPGELSLYRGTGDAGFAHHQTLPWNHDGFYQYIPPPTADLNGDGRLDFVLRAETSLMLGLSQADGTFALQERFTRFGPQSIRTGDLNGDGHVDIAFVSRAQDQLAISAVYGDGTGRFPGYARQIITNNSWAELPPVAKDIEIGDFVPGGAQEIAYGTFEGDIVLLSGFGNELAEVGRNRVDAQDIGVKAIRFRSATRELIAEGFIRHNVNRAAWVVSTAGTIEAAHARVGGRTAARMLAATSGGTFRVDIDSTCPLTGLTEFSFEREGLFVHFATSPVLVSAKAAYLPGELYVELDVKDGDTIRTLKGTLEATPDGLVGDLHELKPTPCGRKWAAHEVTAIPMR